MKDYVVADIKEFIENEINVNNKRLNGTCFLADDRLIGDGTKAIGERIEKEREENDNV